MIYVFDNSPLSALFRNYYPGRFPTLWQKFDRLVAAGELISTREVMRELEDGPSDLARAWCNDNKDCFSTPTAAEGKFIVKIYAVQHFQQNIEQKKLLRGGKNADPFVVAKAATCKGTVVTLEKLKVNAAKIPNICKHFKVPCLSLEEFMEAESWRF